MNYLLGPCALIAMLFCPPILGTHGMDTAQAAESQRSASHSSQAPHGSHGLGAKPAAAQIDCVAKVILHEASNQALKGKIAVAQVIRARMKQRQMSACGVVHEPGQFSHIERYRPQRNTPLWREAVAIASQTLQGKGKDVVPGALFFRSGGRPFKGRLRLARIEDHIFYR